MPRNDVDVEVQPDTSRWTVAPGCWTLCYRFANPNPVTLTLHRVRVRVNPNPGLLKWLVAYGKRIPDFPPGGTQGEMRKDGVPPRGETRGNLILTGFPPGGETWYLDRIFS